jgi:hypothetical protein
MRYHRLVEPGATAIVNTQRDSSVAQARWILIPLFGLWIMFSLAGLLAARIV